MIFKTTKSLSESPKFSLLILLALALYLPSVSFAVGDSTYISTTGGRGFFTLYEAGNSTPLLIEPQDHKGVIRALHDLKSDIGKVTGHDPNIVLDKFSGSKSLVIVGTYGRSRIIDELVKSKKLDMTGVEGKWEAYRIQTIDNPFPGIDQALVIVGSDKRGTIYGIYDVSQKIGVSPWYWWADVAVEHQEALYVKPVAYTQFPKVQYRGIFLNDEAPALTNWVNEKYGTVSPGIDPPVGSGVANYGHEFYARIFELMLRIKANYLWPAMWGNAFNEDDPENPRLADEYGIVMGTSHQEPMLRSQQEWDRRYYESLGHWNYQEYPDTLQNFWRAGIRRNKKYESIVTMGLRGANDSEMEGSIQANIAMVEDIVAKQQEIIREEINTDITQVPQSWCLYKEIMEYYNGGMRVPDHITLLWADDNWGNVRRLPTAEERQRSGGSGVYYHFDYHGGPRSYEWINTNPIAKIWDQMSLAKQYGADKIWIVNVGHFRGYELPMEYFMDLAWDADKWTNTNILEYTRLWAKREFGVEYAEEIADILSKYTKYNGRRKPESLDVNTYSLIHYEEAERIVADYREITRKAEAIYQKLPKEKRNSFYQIVLFPTKASALVNELYVTAAKNHLYASQQRKTTNDMAAKVRNLFQQDTALMAHYNTVYADGRWNHFMDQTHLGYVSWNPPKENSLKAIPLNVLEIPSKAILGVSVEGNRGSWPGTLEEAVLPELDVFNAQQHYIEIFNRGQSSFEFTLTADVPWLHMSQKEGTIAHEDLRVFVELDESTMPTGRHEGTITITGAGSEVSIKVRAFHPSQLKGKKAKGFVESGGVVSIEAEHFSQNIHQGERKWMRVEDYGLTLSGMRATAPANAPAAVPGKDAPYLEYPVYFFSEDSVEVTLVTSPLLNFMPGRSIRLAVSFDDASPQYFTNVPDPYKVHWSNPDWSKVVVNQSRHCKVSLPPQSEGYHTMKVWMIDPGVVVQKVIVNMGGLKPSYLGPPESQYIR